MDLPIDNEELKELMDALNESNHPDAMKRQFRNELHRKLRLTKFLMDEGYPHKKVLDNSKRKISFTSARLTSNGSNTIAANPAKNRPTNESVKNVGSCVNESFSLVNI